MSLTNYWPTNELVNQCIKTEAETLSDALFAAVHQPMTFRQRALIGAGKTVCKLEKDLFKTFTSNQNIESGNLICPIIGSSGVGKSHVIQWLDVHLRSENKGNKWHIIRIPKSASFRRTLTLMLQGLDEGPDLEAKLNLAQDSIDALRATITLQGCLVYSCKKKYAELNEKLKGDYDNVDARKSDKEVHTHLRLIPAFINDDCTGEHLAEKALSEIASRAVDGTKNPGDIKSQFIPDDFILKGVDLKEAGKPAKAYAINLQKAEYREKCSEIINSMIDDAVRELNNLKQGSLQDIFLEIRKSLKKQDRELILLIEDFASMTGIQGELIDGILATDKGLCTVRAAVAVTLGHEGGKYLLRDTVRTRAKFEWLIEDTPFTDDETTLIHIINLVGAYLNVSRLGEDKIEEAYKHSSNKDRISGKWIPKFDKNNAETKNLVEAYGFSDKGYALFPFNKSALEQLSKNELTTSGRIKFHPRTIINNLIRLPLTNNFSQFIKNKFPIPDMSFDNDSITLGAEIETKYLRNLGNKDDQIRYEIFLKYWGGAPKEEEELNKIDSRLYEGFDLPPLKAGIIIEPVSTTATTTTTTTTTSTLPPDTIPRNISDTLRHIEEWRGGTLLPSNASRTIRNAIRDALQNEIDWIAQGLEVNFTDTHKAVAEWVYIENSSGGEGTCTEEDSIATIASKDDYSDNGIKAEIELNLKAVIMRNHYKSWDYNSASKDIIRYYNFIDQLKSKAIEFMRARYFRADFKALPVLRDALASGAKILNVPKAYNNTHAGHISSLFSNPKDQQFDRNTDWGNIQQTTHDHREVLINNVLLITASRQTARGNPLAIDAYQILNADGNLNGVIIPSGLESLQITKRTYRSIASVIKATRHEVKGYLNNIEDELGPDFNNEKKEHFITTLRKVISDAGPEYRNRKQDKEYLRRELTQFKNSAICDQIKTCRTLVEESDEAHHIRAINKLDQSLLRNVQSLLTNLNIFFEDTGKHIETIVKQDGEDGGFNHVIQDIEKSLEKITDLTDSLAKETEA